MPVRLKAITGQQATRPHLARAWRPCGRLAAQRLPGGALRRRLVRTQPFTDARACAPALFADRWMETRSSPGPAAANNSACAREVSNAASRQHPSVARRGPGHVLICRAVSRANARAVVCGPAAPGPAASGRWRKRKHSHRSGAHHAACAPPRDARATARVPSAGVARSAPSRPSPRRTRASSRRSAHGCPL